MLKVKKCENKKLEEINTQGLNLENHKNFFF